MSVRLVAVLAIAVTVFNTLAGGLVKAPDPHIQAVAAVEQLAHGRGDAAVLVIISCGTNLFAAE